MALPCFRLRRLLDELFSSVGAQAGRHHANKRLIERRSCSSRQKFFEKMSMRIRSISMKNALPCSAFRTMTDDGTFFTSYGIGSMTGDAAQLSDSAKAAFVKFFSLCEASGRWRKELTFFQVNDACLAEERVHDALSKAENDTAIFFVCASLKACYAVRNVLYPDNSLNLH